MTRLRLAKVSFLLAGLGLIGCGFHLRGLVTLSSKLQDVAIIVENVNRDLEPMLKERLMGYRIRVSENPKEARYWIILQQDSEEQHITSVSSSTTPRQYQLTYYLTFKFQEALGKEIIPSSRVSATRQLTVNSNRILGSDFEENTLKHEMRKDAVTQIIDRIGHHPL